MTPTNEEARLIFEKALREAYNSGWAQGEREHTSKRGGIPWDDSDLQRNGPDRLLAAHLEITKPLREAADELAKALELVCPEGWLKGNTMYHMTGIKEAKAALARYRAVKGEG